VREPGAKCLIYSTLCDGTAWPRFETHVRRRTIEMRELPATGGDVRATESAPHYPRSDPRKMRHARFACGAPIAGCNTTMCAALCLAPLDDEHGLVVDQVRFAGTTQPLIPPDGVRQQRAADVPGGERAMSPHQFFQVAAFF